MRSGQPRASEPSPQSERVPSNSNPSAQIWSRRSGAEPSLNPLSLLALRLQAEGRSPLDLTVSNPTAVGITYAEDAILEALSHRAMLRYEPLSLGQPAARAAVAQALNSHDRTLTAERVVMTASTSEAYAFLFKLLCDPGDEVLVPAPGYPLLEHLSAFESIRPVAYPLLQDDDWSLDRNALRAAINERTRAIVVVQPNNPTGSILRAEEVAWLASLGLPLIGDEVFADYLLEPRQAFTSVLTAPQGLTFSLGGLSKSAGLPQMKAGWIAVGGEPKRVKQALLRLEFIADTWLSIGTPVQVALPSLLACRHVARDAIIDRVRGNLATLRDALGGDSAITVPRVDGGWVAPMRLPATRDDEAWAMELLERHNIRVQPGHFYDFERGAWLVVSALVEPTTFDRGVAGIIAAVQAD